MKPAWLLSRSLAVLVAAGFSAYCNSTTDPSGSDVRADSWVLDRSHSQLAVGDTGEIRVVLFKGSDTLDIRSLHRGEIVVNVYSDGHGSAQVIDWMTTNIRTYRIEGHSPGTVYLQLRYGEYGPCQDPPECFMRNWTSYLPDLADTVEVQ
jgi:hypothetical protein